MIMDYPEGATPLDREELEGLKFKHVTQREQLNQLEQANIQAGLIWLKKLKKSSDILSESFIKKLHQKLFGQVWIWAGTFRQSGKNIGVDCHDIPVELRKLLDDVDYWKKNKTFQPIEIAVRFHHRLVKIHLFPNGNGRHARIITDLLLVHIFACDEINWEGSFDLQSINPRREAYLAALRSADKGDYKLLLKFVDPQNFN